MEEISDSSSRCDLLILHTPEAQEWAEYIDRVVKPSLCGRSLLSYALSYQDRLPCSDHEHFQRSECVLLLLTSSLLELLSDETLHGALKRLLQPPRSVVALLCGVSEEDVPAETFRHWAGWRKLHADDEPDVYISTILEAMADGNRQTYAGEAPETPSVPSVPSVEAANQMAGKDVDEPEGEEYVSAEEGEPDPTDDPSSGRAECGAVAPDSACLTVQPNRILCGERTTIYIILLHKVDIQSKTEVEFSSDSIAPQHVPATVLNEYTISVTAPDMPAGPVSLTLVSDQASVGVAPVTYYTCMEEVSRHLENATSPVEFICQAFNITSDKTETLDNMLTDLLSSNMPVGGLQLFGIKQMEMKNMSTYQRKEDLPTLLHFAARYGLKKLTTALLHCPGALQAYSIMNHRGEYPNTMAERCGYTDLRQFMDAFVETADMLKSHIQDEDSAGGEYVTMAARSQDMDRYSGHGEDIYESMLDMLDPECADDLYEVMAGVEENQNPEEAMLRKFFQVKPGAGQSQDVRDRLETEDTEEVVRQNGAEPREKEEATEDMEEEEEDEEDNYEPDVYNTSENEIYHAVDHLATYPLTQSALNRPPAPMPRPENSASLDTNPYITRAFTDKFTPPKTPARQRADIGSQVVGGANLAVCSSASDTYMGVKTPGQRQLIALQERVKLGVISVDQAVQEFKAWQFDHERRSHSLRYQQENLKRLRNSITRRHKERQKKGKSCELEITAPIQNMHVGDCENAIQYSVYGCTPPLYAPPPPPGAGRPQRGNWKTGSTSSTSSTESNRLSTHSIISSSSGTEPDFEDTMDLLPLPPPPPPRVGRGGAALPAPPHLHPPPVPDRNVPPMQLDAGRYVSRPTRAVPQRPAPRSPLPLPPLPLPPPPVPPRR